MRNAILFLLLSVVMAIVSANEDVTTEGQEPELKLLTEWRAGCKVNLNAVKQYGVDRCFVAEKIGKSVYARMKGHSYKRGCTVPLPSLRYLRLLHYDNEGNIRLGEMVCSSAVSSDLIDIFRQLYEARYPIERMVLVDDYDADDERSMTANNTTCFNYRAIAGTGRLSKHSQGRAVDINPLYNPHVHFKQGKIKSVSPQAGRRYADRTLRQPMMINRNDLCYRLFTQHGFRWGGAWRSSKDYQHFEK